MDTDRILRVLGGTAALVIGVAVAGWAISTLWTVQRNFDELGLTSRFIQRSLAMGAVEIALAAGLIYLSARCFSSKPFSRTAELASN